MPALSMRWERVSRSIRRRSSVAASSSGMARSQHATSSRGQPRAKGTPRKGSYEADGRGALTRFGESMRVSRHVFVQSFIQFIHNTPTRKRSHQAKASHLAHITPASFSCSRRALTLNSFIHNTPTRSTQRQTQSQIDVLGQGNSSRHTLHSPIHKTPTRKELKTGLALKMRHMQAAELEKQPQRDHSQ